MVSNIKQALPQSGLSSADICYEALAEGGITRIMAVFSDYTELPKTGPVRSARDYYLQLAAPLDTIFVNFGTSTIASDMIRQKNVDNIDGMYYSTLSFTQDKQRAASRGREHSFYIDAQGLQKAIDKAKIDTAQTSVRTTTPQNSLTAAANTSKASSAKRRSTRTPAARSRLKTW